ncbi:unnamed protein product [Linum trigynum]|uniref:DYW domain-containing protein n=1 Tax=Linum trigynum TaxID=586398 RepID=A0AAV2DG59_9ROSI
MNINVKFRPSDLIKRRGWSRDRHGVKLAICLGLFSTAVGKPVVVRQNMRICEDCHRFAKKISRACNREIAKSSTISMVAFVLAGITGKEFMKVRYGLYSLCRISL